MGAVFPTPRIGAPKSVKDVVYTVVGFAVLATQRVQTRRRDLQKQVAPTVREAAVKLQDAAGAIDERLGPLFDELENRIPGTSRTLVHQARGVARETRDVVLKKAAGTS
jgi:hypothetical protein